MASSCIRKHWSILQDWSPSWLCLASLSSSISINTIATWCSDTSWLWYQLLVNTTLTPSISNTNYRRSDTTCCDRKKEETGQIQSNIWIRPRSASMGYTSFTMRKKISTRGDHTLSTLIYQPLSQQEALTLIKALTKSLKETLSQVCRARILDGLRYFLWCMLLYHAAASAPTLIATPMTVLEYSRLIYL